MTKFRNSSVLCATPVLALVFAAGANAQATRTWVSGVGDDANPCSRTAPCKTFAGAISKTAVSGEINVLDPGGFGAVTITKAISIINDGVGEAGVLVAGTNGIVVAAGPTDNVTLKGLTIDGLGPTAGSINGVQFNSGASLTVEKCRIMEFQSSVSSGIFFQPNSAATLNVRDTVILTNGTSSTGGGILVQPVSGGSANVVLDHVNVMNNFNFGISINGTTSGAGAVSMSVSNSVSSGNGAQGLVSVTSGAILNVMIDLSTFANNGTFGVRSTGATSTIRIGNSTITGNGTGLSFGVGGTLLSFGNNLLNGNSSDGAPSSTITTK